MNGTDLGSVMTAGSGMPLNLLYEETKSVGKFYVGGITATVVLAGGYIQGAGHSAFSPIFGLGADNALGMLMHSITEEQTLISVKNFRWLLQMVA